VLFYILNRESQPIDLGSFTPRFYAIRSEIAVPENDTQNLNGRAPYFEVDLTWQATRDFWLCIERMKNRCRSTRRRL
jgi:hypothetical protein